MDCERDVKGKQMRTIELKTSTTIPDGTFAPGLYEYCGSLYIAQGSGMWPMCVPIGNIQIRTIEDSSGGGISENALLKAIAIAQRPELAKELI